MHPALELMLARMESNPEEFVDNGRWVDIMRELTNFVSEEERKLLFEKQKAIRLDLIHKKIMQELCAPEQQEWREGWSHPTFTTSSDIALKYGSSIVKTETKSGL
jgi:hypothetical protein